jgi:flavin-dependent dehydrogenase
MLVPATVERIERDGDAWRVDVACGAAEVRSLRAALILDAGGRAAPVARRLGAQTRVDDRLICGWVYGRDGGEGSRGLTFVEAVEEGWWYTAPMPSGRRVVAFHTDADLPAARLAADRHALLAHAASTQQLAAWLADAGFVADEHAGFTAAHTAVLEPCAGDGFLAAGDAAMAFDPLSSQGLLNALFTGLAAAEAADAHLSGDADALPRYRETIARIFDAYRRHLGGWYALEQRWPQAAFWKRRR